MKTQGILATVLVFALVCGAGVGSGRHKDCLQGCWQDLDRFGRQG